MCCKCGRAKKIKKNDGNTTGGLLAFARAVATRHKPCVQGGVISTPQKTIQFPNRILILHLDSNSIYDQLHNNRR